MLTMDTALFKLLGQYGFAPDLVMGHSLGEYGALIAAALCPAVKPYLIASHLSVERGHGPVWQALGLRPLLDIDLRLGEGTGAVLALHLIEAACRILAEMATFADAFGVLDKYGIVDAVPAVIVDRLRAGIAGQVPETPKPGDALFEGVQNVFVGSNANNLTLVNRTPYAVDLSHWRLEGAVQHTFQPGVVLPAGGTLYVAKDVVAFRHRTVSPTGNEGRFAQGN